MQIESGGIALIRGGPSQNLGKFVFVVGHPDDPRLPCVGGAGELWDVQMVVSPLLGPDGEEYVRVAIGGDWLMPVQVTPELAAAMRAQGLLVVFDRAVAEWLEEDFGRARPGEAYVPQLEEAADGDARQRKLPLDFATPAAVRLAGMARDALIANRHTLSGDSGLGNVWEEICVQVRAGEMPFWCAYEAAMRDAVLAALPSLCAEDVLAVWLKSDAGRDWRYRQDDDERDSPPVDDEEVAAFVIRDYLGPMADNYSNKRIERFLFPDDDC